MLEPTTILSNQFFGFKRGNNPTSYLITRYDFENETEIILNEIGDDNIEEYD